MSIRRNVASVFLLPIKCLAMGMLLLRHLVWSRFFSPGDPFQDFRPWIDDVQGVANASLDDLLRSQQSATPMVEENASLQFLLSQQANDTGGQHEVPEVQVSVLDFTLPNTEHVVIQDFGTTQPVEPNSM
jgi:hypothetical protein